MAAVWHFLTQVLQVPLEAATVVLLAVRVRRDSKEKQ